MSSLKERQYTCDTPTCPGRRSPSCPRQDALDLIGGGHIQRNPAIIASHLQELRALVPAGGQDLRENLRVARSGGDVQRSPAIIVLRHQELRAVVPDDGQDLRNNL